MIKPTSITVLQTGAIFLIRVIFLSDSISILQYPDFIMVLSGDPLSDRDGGEDHERIGVRDDLAEAALEK